MRPLRFKPGVGSAYRRGGEGARGNEAAAKGFGWLTCGGGTGICANGPEPACTRASAARAGVGSEEADEDDEEDEDKKEEEEEEEEEEKEDDDDGMGGSGPCGRPRRALMAFAMGSSSSFSSALMHARL